MGTFFDKNIGARNEVSVGLALENEKSKSFLLQHFEFHIQQHKYEGLWII